MKIYTNSQFYADRHIGMWMDFEGIPYDFADTGYRINCTDNNQLQLAVFHTHENQIAGIEQIASESCPIVTNVWQPEYTNPNVIFNDFLWNRTKAYYTGYQFSEHTRRWYYANPKSYAVPNQAFGTKTRIFTAPNNTHSGTRTYRSRLVNHLKTNYTRLGFVSPLETEAEEQFTGPGYQPPHSDYYLNSCISIYGETIESGTGICVTEKTWDPLIKGHFILPFSNSGFIAYLHTQGVKFPTWIDYSYDSIEDDAVRYIVYQAEVDRLLGWTTDIWATRWADSYAIMRHNQDLLYTRPYHKTGILSQVDQKYL